MDLDQPQPPPPPSTLSLDPTTNDDSNLPPQLPRPSPHALSSASSTSTNRKARSADPGTSSGNVHRSSVSLPLTSQLLLKGRYPNGPTSPKQSRTSHPHSPPSGLSGESMPGPDVDKTPTLESTTQIMTPTAPFMLPDPAIRAQKQPEDDTESSRLSFSSLYSLGSAIVNGARGIAASAPSSVAGSEPELSTSARSDAFAPSATTAHSSVAVTTSSHNGTLGASPPNGHPADHIQPALSHRASIHFSTSGVSLPRATIQSRHSHASTSHRSRSKTRDPRRMSRSTATTSGSPASDRPAGTEKRKAPGGIIGVCALDTKARSKPSRNILNRLIANGEFDILIFGDKIILDEDVENWPVCDYLISFFSDGFPLKKAIAYERLRRPYCVNNLPMQTVLWDRRLCLMILDSFNIPTPKRLEVNRDGGPRLSSADLAIELRERTGLRLPGAEDDTGGGMPAPKSVEIVEDGDVLVVDGKRLRKPFVEKPVSGEDHNIHIYFPQSTGGGGRRLFRKVNNKSSERDETLKTPRAITEPKNSYVYEQFVEAARAEDIKAYTVGASYCHAETRKSPVVDGIVKRNPSGKELRYVTELNAEEREVASKVVKAFGQTICGFDLLRSDGRSYVIDVNGWSFVKDNNEYYDKCAKILRDMFLSEKLRQEGKHQVHVPEPKSSMESESGSSQTQPTPSQRSLKDIFRSPSLSKLAAHHPNILHLHQHSHNHHHQKEATSSDTAPISPPSTLDGPASAVLPVASQPVLPTTAMEKNSMSNTAYQSRPPDQRSPVPPPASKAQWTLKGMVSVVRHADRTPKQKFKFTFHTKPFVDLLRGHQEEVLIVGEAALNSVLDAVNIAIKEGKEDMAKLQLLRTSLVKKGGWAGTKVQIKPMFRSRWNSATGIDEKTPNDPAKPELNVGHRDSAENVTLSRISAVENNLVLDKLQLIIKWGGEPTHSARYQAQDLGENLRNDLLLMNRDCLEHVMVFSSSERRVTTSAQIFASSFIGETNLAPNFIQVRKDLLDDSNAAKDDMDKVKKKLKQLLREGDAAPPEFAWPESYPEPFLIVRRVVELMRFHHRVMKSNYQKLQTHATNALAAAIKAYGHESPGPKAASPMPAVTSAHMVSNIQPRWCSGEDADLFRERWEKLFKEFTDADKVDPSKISELYDTLKFDALHNRQFLEWIFLPDIDLFEGSAVSEATTPDVNIRARSGTSNGRMSPRRGSFTKDEEKQNSKDWKAIVQKIGLRRASEATEKSTGSHSSNSNQKAGEAASESYFNLYKSPTSDSKAKHDARLGNLRELYTLAKTLFDYIGPQEYGISPDEKLSIGLLTSLPLLKEIVHDLEEMQASEGGSSFFYFTKESHIYTLLNCIIEGGIKTKIERKKIPELDYLSQINFELYESQNAMVDEEKGKDRYNYSIRISISPGCHTFDPLDLMLDSKHCIGIAPRRSLTAHEDYKEVLETLRAKLHSVKLPKSFIAINLSEISPQLFGPVRKPSTTTLPSDDDQIESEHASGAGTDVVEKTMSAP